MSKPRAKKEPLTRAEINDANLDMVRRHVSQLSEHMASVQIMATSLLPDGTTVGFTLGSGDIYARRQLTLDWLNRVTG